MAVHGVRLKLPHLALDGLNQLEVASGIEPLVGKTQSGSTGSQIVGGALRIAGLVVLAVAIANRLGRTDDENPDLVSALEMADERATGTQNLIVRMGANDQHPPTAVQGTERLSPVLGELGQQVIGNGRVAVEPEIAQSDAAVGKAGHNAAGEGRSERWLDAPAGPEVWLSGMHPDPLPAKPEIGAGIRSRESPHPAVQGCGGMAGPANQSVLGPATWVQWKAAQRPLRDVSGSNPGPVLQPERR
jgi:hypothetical protein